MLSTGSMLQLFALLTGNFSSVSREALQPLQFAPSAALNRTAIGDIARAICRQEAHVVCLLRYPNGSAIATEQQLLRALSTDCAAPAAVRIMDDVELRSAADERSTVAESSVYVLVLPQVSDFRPHIFDPNMGAKQFQRYFVVIEGWVRRPPQAGWRHWLRDMFRVFWMKQVLNVVVIFNDGDADGSGQPKWFTYTPFGCVDTEADPHDSNIWHVPVVPANDGDQQLRTIRVQSGDERLFAGKLDNVYGSEMTVSMAVDEVRAMERADFERHGFDGVDGRVADLIRERMNATFRYFRPTLPFTGANTTGVLGDLYFRNADFGFNAQSHVPSLHGGLVETSNSFERHNICILVPSSAAEPTLFNLLYTMTPLTWTIVSVSICTAVVTYRWMLAAHRALIISPQARENLGAYSWPETMSVHFQSFFGDSICTLPRSWPLRLLIWCWCLYSFLITTAFTAKLISSLVLPRHLADIDTLRGLADSPLNVVYPQHLNATLWQFLSGDEDTSLLAGLRDQMRAVPGSPERFHALMGAERTANAYVVHSYMAKYMRRKYVDAQTGRSAYHLMHECLVYLPKVYLLEKGSPYVGHVNELLGRFNEMGFMGQWEEETTHRFAVQAGPQAAGILLADGDGGGGGDGAGGSDEDDLGQLAEEDIKVVITVSHLQTAFYLLALGLAMATLAFAGERWQVRRERLRTLYRVVYFDKRLAREYGCKVNG